MCIYAVETEGEEGEQYLGQGSVHKKKVDTGDRPNVCGYLQYQFVSNSSRYVRILVGGPTLATCSVTGLFLCRVSNHLFNKPP